MLLDWGLEEQQGSRTLVLKTGILQRLAKKLDRVLEPFTRSEN